jgi:hypothetical protein
VGFGIAHEFGKCVCVDRQRLPRAIELLACRDEDCERDHCRGVGHHAIDGRSVLGTVKALRVASTAHSAWPSGLDGACAQLADWQLRDGRRSDGAKWARVFQMRRLSALGCVARRHYQGDSIESEPSRYIPFRKSNPQSGDPSVHADASWCETPPEPNGIPLAL